MPGLIFPALRGFVGYGLGSSGGPAPVPPSDLRSALIAKLKADGPLVASIVDPDRIRCGWSAQRDGLPRIAIQVLSSRRGQHLDGPAGFAKARVQFEVVAGSTIDAAKIAERLAAVLEGARGYWGAVFVSDCHQLDETETAEWRGDGSGRALAVLRTDYRVRHSSPPS